MNETEGKAAKEMDLPKIDAEALITAYGDGAYEQARMRARDQRRGEVIDGNRPEGHWDQVRREIARRTGRRGRIDTATRYLDC